TGTGGGNEFADGEAALRLAIQRAQHALLGGGEQCIGKTVRRLLEHRICRGRLADTAWLRLSWARGLCTHIGYFIAQYGYLQHSKRLPVSLQKRHAGSFGRTLVERVGGPAAGIGRRYRDQGIGEFSVVLLELSEGSPDTFGTFD